MTGIEVRGGSIRITFHWGGKRCRETLEGWAVTPPNLKAAARLRQEVMDKIRIGAFDYREYFPHSKRARRLGVQPGRPADSITFEEVGKLYLGSLTGRLAYSTVEGYGKLLSRYWYPKLGELPIHEIGYDMLAKIDGDTRWRSRKTRNNAVSVLRCVFGFAKDAKYIGQNPALPVKLGRHQKREPDPLRLSEVDAVLAALQGGWKNYFEYACFAGLRTSELIALRWEDVDFEAGLVRVCRARVRRRNKMETKNYRTRLVRMNARSRAALLRQKALTYEAGEWVFTKPGTHEQINDDKPPRLVWLEAVARAGVRRRVAYQTRHTYATLLIMSGEPVAWVAEQLGDTVQMLLDRYARWIEGVGYVDPGAKLDAVLGQNLGQTGGSEGNEEE